MKPANQPESNGSPSTVRRLTGAQPAAIAVFEMQGQLALEIAAGHLFLKNQQPLWQQSRQRIAFGYWNHRAKPLSPDNSTSTEDVVFCRTGPESAELHTHGSPAIADSIFAAFRNGGVVVLDPKGEGCANSAGSDLTLPMIMPFLEPAWWESSVGVVTPARWESLCEQLAAAEFPTYDLCRLQSLTFDLLGRARAAEVGSRLWAQLRGAWLLCLEAIARKVVARSGTAVSDLDELLATWSWGRFLSRDIQVLITGAPNVGKSSLINALLGYQRNIVSDRPGTTRDLVGQTTAMAGWQVRLVDSAGLRRSDDELENQGIQLATAAAQDADVVVVVRSVDVPEPTGAVLPENVPIVSVLNKVDLLDPAAKSTGSSEQGGTHSVSTQTGQGLPELVQSIVSAVVPPMKSELFANGIPPAVVFSSEAWQVLSEWRERILHRQFSHKSLGEESDGRETKG